MNFLELCQAAASDSGTIAGLPSFTTLVGASGRVLQLKGWVRDAYIDIQNERRDWLWMRKRFTAPLTIGQREYTAAQLGIADLNNFLPDTPDRRTMSLYDPAQGQAQESYIEMMSEDYYEQTYNYGAHDPQQPAAWAKINGGLAVGPTPDKAYVLRGRYHAAPQRLEADTDIPEMPAAYHRLIVGEAIRLMARSDEAFTVLAERADNYMRLRNPLVRDQTEDVSYGAEPFA